MSGIHSGSALRPVQTMREFQEQGFQAYAKDINDKKLAEKRQKNKNDGTARVDGLDARDTLGNVTPPSDQAQQIAEMQSSANGMGPGTTLIRAMNKKGSG